MTKKILTFTILFIVLAGVFAPVKALATDCAWVFSGACTIGNQQCTKPLVGPVTCTTASGTQANPVTETAKFTGGTSLSIWEQIATGVGQFLMMISSFVLIFSGMIFDWVLKFTIVDMAQNIGGSTGVGASITLAWATLRDIANMCFIFVLLYAAFKTMFDANFGNFQTTIKNIIIVALLINFSLFFSKVVIDASNIVAIGFYKSITSTSSISVNTVSGTSVSTPMSGISAGYMNLLGLQSWYSANILTNNNMKPTQILIVGIMSSIFFLVTAVILLITAIMFIARYIILIFIMILSPLALIAFIIPGQEGKFKEWREALVAQSFFAPLFFALTWVVFKLASNPNFLGALKPATGTNYTDVITKLDTSAAALVLNYVLIIGFSIAALIFAKTMASKTAGFKAISGGIGTAVIGGAALAGRNTIGRASGLVSEKYRDKWSESKLGRAGLWMADKGKKGSFDVRATETLGKVPGLGKELDIMGKAGGKGGFHQAVEDKAKRKAAYAKEVYGQTGAEKEKQFIAEDATTKHEAAKKVEEDKFKSERKTKEEETEKAKNEASKELEEKEKIANQLKSDRLAGITINPAEEAKATKEVEEGRLKLKKITEAHRLAVEKAKAKIEDSEFSSAVQALKTEADVRKAEWDKVKSLGAERQRAYAERLDKGLPGTRWLGRFQPNQGYKEAAREIRKQAREKSKAEKLADAARDYQKYMDETSGTAPTIPSTPAAPATPPPPPPASPASP